MGNYNLNLDNSLQDILREASPVSNGSILYSDDYDLVVVHDLEEFRESYMSVSSSALCVVAVGCVFYTYFLKIVKSIIGAFVGGNR